MLRTACGKTKSRSGRPFSEAALKHHQRSCPKCNHRLHQRQKSRDFLGEYNFRLTNLIADDDMPDGAYFALAHELGEL